MRDLPMSDLNAIRQTINRIDGELTRLFAERMGCALDVARSKLENGGAILNREREAAIHESLRTRFPQELQGAGDSFFTTLILLSRERQYRAFVDAGRLPACMSTLTQAQPKDSCAYYGSFGSWSHQAACKLLPQAALQSAVDFEQVFRLVGSGEVDCGVVPIENSTAGTVREVYDLLLRHRLSIVEATTLDIEYCLVSTGSDDTVRAVYSHPQALSQCAAWLKERALTPRSCSDTAGAAALVQERGDPGIAALCNRFTAEHLALPVLHSGIRDAASNTTRFIRVARSPVCGPDADTVSVVLHTPHERGALAFVLDVFRDYGVNLLKIESRPMPESPFTYSFYLDFSGSLRDKNIQAILLQLECELPFFKLLGNYREL